jgi:hypothetical protein
MLWRVGSLPLQPVAPWTVAPCTGGHRPAPLHQQQHPTTHNPPLAQAAERDVDAWMANTPVRRALAKPSLEAQCAPFAPRKPTQPYTTRHTDLLLDFPTPQADHDKAVGKSAKANKPANARKNTEDLPVRGVRQQLWGAGTKEGRVRGMAALQGTSRCWRINK